MLRSWRHQEKINVTLVTLNWQGSWQTCFENKHIFLSFERSICLTSTIIWSHCLILLFATLVVWLHTLWYDDWPLNANTWWHVVPIIDSDIIYADLVNMYSCNIFNANSHTLDTVSDIILTILMSRCRMCLTINSSTCLSVGVIRSRQTSPR